LIPGSALMVPRVVDHQQLQHRYITLQNFLQKIYNSKMFREFKERKTSYLQVDKKGRNSSNSEV